MWRDQWSMLSSRKIIYLRKREERFRSRHLSIHFISPNSVFFFFTWFVINLFIYFCFFFSICWQKCSFTLSSSPAPLSCFKASRQVVSNLTKARGPQAWLSLVWLQSVDVDWLMLCASRYSVGSHKACASSLFSLRLFLFRICLVGWLSPSTLWINSSILHGQQFSQCSRISTAKGNWLCRHHPPPTQRRPCFRHIAPWSCDAWQRQTRKTSRAKLNAHFGVFYWRCLVRFVQAAFFFFFFAHQKGKTLLRSPVLEQARRIVVIAAHVCKYLLEAVTLDWRLTPEKIGNRDWRNPSAVVAILLLSTVNSGFSGA